MQRATSIVQKNSAFIRNAAQRYPDVTPEIVSAMIFGEQGKNYDWKDKIVDTPAALLAGMNTSVGIGQVRIDTARGLIKEGYVKNLPPGIENDQWKLTAFLNNPGINTQFVAAMAQSIIDRWKGVYPEIKNDIPMIATNYSGWYTPRKNPQNNPFGDFVHKHMDTIQRISPGQLYQ